MLSKGLISQTESVDFEEFRYFWHAKYAKDI